MNFFAFVRRWCNAACFSELLIPEPSKVRHGISLSDPGPLTWNFLREYCLKFSLDVLGSNEGSVQPSGMDAVIDRLPLCPHDDLDDIQVVAPTYSLCIATSKSNFPIRAFGIAAPDRRRHVVLLCGSSRGSKTWLISQVALWRECAMPTPPTQPEDERWDQAKTLVALSGSFSVDTLAIKTASKS